MWKALIKLVESWSYRCDHEWEKVMINDHYDKGASIPHTRIMKYACNKCMKVKTVGT